VAGGGAAREWRRSRRRQRTNETRAACRRCATRRRRRRSQTAERGLRRQRPRNVLKGTQLRVCPRHVIRDIRGYHAPLRSPFSANAGARALAGMLHVTITPKRHHFDGITRTDNLIWRCDISDAYMSSPNRRATENAARAWQQYMKIFAMPARHSSALFPAGDDANALRVRANVCAA